jgi:DNA repair protein RecO (recombination protein O)
MLTVKGIVLRQRTVGEQDRFIDILTAEDGVMEVLVKGAGKISSKTGSGTQLFAYSEFCLNDKKKGARMLSSVSPIQIFYGLRGSVTAVALASYFSQILTYAVLPRAGTPELLRLMLNCLHYLSQKEPDEPQIKAVFELRCASLLGFMPDVVMCHRCGTYLPASLFFVIEDGHFFCQDCRRSSDELRHLADMPAAGLQAVRHIVLSDFEKIFSFRVKGEAREKLCRFAEDFLRYHVDADFQTLEFYKALHQNSAE